MPKHSNVDKVLVKKAQAGDKSAFNQLILKYQSQLLRVINQYIHDPNEALDVLQDTFIKAYRGIEAFRGESTFYSWVYKIAVNTAKNYLTKLKRKSSQLKIQSILKDVEVTSVEDDHNHPGEHHLLKAFESLPKSFREAMTLREIGGLSYLEIAEAMCIPIGTVRSRISRARTILARSQ